MSNKNPAKRPFSTPTSRQMAKNVLIWEYVSLHQDWGRELQNDSTDWTTLFHIYYRLADLEQRAPWLKTEVLA